MEDSLPVVGIRFPSPSICSTSNPKIFSVDSSNGKKITPGAWFNVGSSSSHFCDNSSTTFSRGWKTPVVIDIGSFMTYAGFAGDDNPVSMRRSCVWRPKLNQDFKNIIDSISFEREKAYFEYWMTDERGAYSDHLIPKYPINYDWGDVEDIWAHIFHNQLSVNPAEHPVLLTEPPFSPKEIREKKTELMFESFGPPAFYLTNTSRLSLFATGRTTGIVFDCGYYGSSAVPVYEGHHLPYAIFESDVAGLELINHLIALLPAQENTFTAWRGVVREIMESQCYVSLNYDNEQCKATSKPYGLPDGTIVNLGSELFTCPEGLFKPRAILGVEADGIHELTNKSITRTDADIQSVLYSNIVAAGGCTMFPGFPDRMRKEMTELAPRQSNINILFPPERKYSSWLGGSILGSCESCWITKMEYQEYGPSIVHCKCP